MSSEKKILVTGATGKTGSAVVAQLLQKGWPVRAVVHSKDVRSQKLEKLGAEVVVADLFDPLQLTDAMRGTSRAYYCPPFHAYMIQSAVAFAVAAQETGLESIVGLSQWLASPQHPSMSTRQHWLADRLFAKLDGISLTVLNPGLFAEFPYLEMMEYASQLGLFPMPGDPNSLNAPPSNDDIARVAVEALINPQKHAGKTYRPTGPELISIKEMTNILSRVLKRKVQHVPMPMWMFYKAAGMSGVSPFLMSGLRYYVQEHNNGTFGFGGVTNDVLEVTGNRPESFEAISQRYAAREKFKPSPANQLRAFMKFMAVPFQPSFNPDQFEKQQGFPMPDKRLLDMSNEFWKTEHSRTAIRPLEQLNVSNRQHV